ncbi:hypothetical protein RAS2_17020 [Phycisphaerae bacterium RAS2]|nr:hypothetical protein RAS2_17020 [Phycisphaerae bacterium RAS2]
MSLIELLPERAAAELIGVSECRLREGRLSREVAHVHRLGRATACSGWPMRWNGKRLNCVGWWRPAWMLPERDRFAHGASSRPRQRLIRERLRGGNRDATAQHFALI